MHEKVLANFSENFNKLQTKNNFYYAIGGGNQILSEFVKSFGFDEQSTVVLKISSRIGGRSWVKSKENQVLTNANFLSHFKSEISENAKIYQFALQGYLCNKDEIQNTCSQNSELFWLDKIIRKIDVQKFDSTKKTQFGVFLETFFESLQKTNKRVIVLFDCETIESQYMVGVSCPGIEGISKDEYVEMMEIFGENHSIVDGLLNTNYNPAVETKVSAE